MQRESSRRQHVAQAGGAGQAQGTSRPRERPRLECVGGRPSSRPAGLESGGQARGPGAGGGRQAGALRAGRTMGPARVSGGLEPPRWTWPPHVSRGSDTPTAAALSTPSLAPGLQANGFPCSRENRGSLQSCSEPDALFRASWSVSRQPGSMEPHMATPPPLCAPPPPQRQRTARPLCRGSHCPPPRHLSPHFGTIPPRPPPP